MLYFLSPKLNFDFTKKYNLFLQRKKMKYHAVGQRFVQFHEISFLMYAAAMMHTAKFCWLIKCV